jgi:hypothetical protein
MKKVNLDYVAEINGGSCPNGAAALGGAMCAGAVFGGLIGGIMFGPSCLALVYACFS